MGLLFSPPSMKTVLLLAAMMALVSGKSIEMGSLKLQMDANVKKMSLLGSASDCEGATDASEDVVKCQEKMPTNVNDLMKCIKLDGDTAKITCADAKCKEWAQCIIKAVCKAIKSAKNPAGCEAYVKKELFDKMFDADCNAKCDDPMLLIIIIVVVLLLVAVGVFCYCRRKKAAAGGDGK